MDNIDEWHVVERKKKETKTHTSPYVPITKNNISQNTNKSQFTQKKSINTNSNFQKNHNNFQKSNTKFNYPQTNINTFDNVVDKQIDNKDEDKNNLENSDNTNVDLQNLEINTSGNDIPLLHNYVLWVHSINDNDWSINGYKRLYIIKNVSDFWKLFNNIHKLNFRNNNFYFMKPNVQPIWEDESNRHGGICSLRIELDHALKVYELLCIFLACEKLVGDISDINGISITPKNNWAIIKIWNKDKNKKISELLHKSILDKYKHVSIQYKPTQPEY